MRFFEAQRAARRNSAYLVALFVLNTLILSWCNAFLFGFIIRVKSSSLQANPVDLEVNIFLVSVVIFILLTWYFVATTASGPDVAVAMGGRLLGQPKTEEEKKLRNVVEEMSIASGVPVPAIYVLEAETGVNAFAAGKDSHGMVIAVTRGAMEQLSRDELQGVVAHEFSHILNEDMALNMKLAGVVTTFLVFLKVGESFKSSRRTIGRSKEGAQAAMIAMTLMLFGAVGSFLGRFLQGFISREREYLADASSAQFTRNPESLASALGKILLGAGSELSGSKRVEFAHIFFAEGLSAKWTLGMATHPPLIKRISKLLPGRNLDDFLTHISSSLTRNDIYQSHAQRRVEEFISQAPNSNSILSSIGAPVAVNLTVTERSLDKLSEVRGFLHDQKIARAALALVTFHSQPSYAEALHFLKDEFPTESVFQKFEKIVDRGDESLRVTLFHVALGTLRENPLRDKAQVVGHMKEVFESDQRITLLEALLLLNAEILLLPGHKITQGVRIDRSILLQAVCQMAQSSEAVSLQKLREFAASFSNVSLIEKKKIVEKLVQYFLTAEEPKKEEFRLLCMAIKIPVPAF